MESLRPLAAVLVTAAATLPILASRGRPDLREGWTLLAAVANLVIVGSMVPGVLDGRTYETTVGTLVPGVEFTLQADALGVLFGLLASLLWLVTSFYSIGYMRGLDESDQTRYFAAFAGSVASAVGIAFAGNLLVLFVFYELLTVATYPLVSHDETDEARAAGRKYLTYTFGGGVAVLAGAVMVYWLTGTTAFTPGGIAGLSGADLTLARVAFGLLITGFGVKAALMPLHSWLPDAMVAPTPVSGLLHAVAVVKSGIFGIARVILDVYGPETVAEIGMGIPLAVVAAFTLTVASVIALRQDNLKRRLAFSTVSQLSYIVLGLAVGAAAAPGAAARYALIGGLLHIPAHAFMKLTLFFCAGAIHVETHTDDISDMAGIGRRMPLTMTAFGVAALGMAGIPVIAGFVSKYFLLIGTVSAGYLAFTGALLLSGVLNIAYFWPVVYAAFFESKAGSDAKPLIESPLGGRLFGDDTELATDGGKDEHADGDDAVDDEHADGDDAVDDEHADGDDAVDDEHADGDDANDGEHADGDDAVGGEHDEHGYADDHEGDHGHGHGGDWEARGWFGGESTWFMLGPILFAASGSILLGVIPDAAVFLRIVREVVFAVTGVRV